MDQKKLDQQSQHWEKNFSSKSEMFGLEPSHSAKKTLEIFKKNNINYIVKHGAGLGRDTKKKKKNALKVHALDYSPSAIKIIKEKAKENNLEDLITAEIFDIRKKLPFDDQKFQGCYSHMLYCMALTNLDVKKLNDEICRVLKNKGINIYTVRNTIDADYKKGNHNGEDLYEIDGFVINFFSNQKIKSLLNGFLNLSIENFDEGSFPRKLSLVINKKNK